MTDKNIPDEVKKFIYKYVESLEQLEVLLLLCNNSSQSYSAEMIAHELRGNPLSISIRLVDLSSCGFLKPDNKDDLTYKYNSNQEDSTIRLLNTYYTNYHHVIISLIFSKPLGNIRSFADAFKFKKDDADG